MVVAAVSVVLRARWCAVCEAELGTETSSGSSTIVELDGSQLDAEPPNAQTKTPRTYRLQPDIICGGV